jgi:short-subunit dehydrogenase
MGLDLKETLHPELQREGSPVGVSIVCPGAVRTGLVDAPSEAPGGALQGRLKTRMAEAGLEPLAVAEAVFEGVEAGRFWIFPQPAFKTAARERFDRLLAEEDPVRPA